MSIVGEIKKYLQLRWKNEYRCEIPKPTGEYKVGCTDVMTMYSHKGSFFRLFYPAEMYENAITSDWLPHERYLVGYAKYFKIWPPLYCKTFPKFVGDVTVPASWNAIPLRRDGHKYPVVVFSHGLGGCRTTYTTLCLELASNGYVVAAVEHRDYSACSTFYYAKAPPKDATTGSEGVESEVTQQWMFLQKVKPGKGEYEFRNKQVHQRAKECSLALDLLDAMDKGDWVENILSSVPLASFKGLLDMRKAAIGGHSFGGATSIATLSEDKRFKVAFGLDTWMLPLNKEPNFDRVEQPMLFINMEKFQTKANLIVMKKMESTNIDRKIITLKGTVHLNQCDVPFLCDRTMRVLFGAHSKLNRFTAMHLTTKLTMSFLSKHLDLPPNGDHQDYIASHQNVMIHGITSN